MWKWKEEGNLLWKMLRRSRRSERAMSLSPPVELSLCLFKYKACPSESGTEVGAPLFPAVELCDFPGRWQCMSGEIW